MNIKMYIKKVRLKIQNNKGLTYLEYTLMLMFLLGLLYTFVQIYGFINTQIKVSNAARNALRRVELAGAVVYQDPNSDRIINVLDDARTDLSGNANIDPDTVKIMVNDPTSNQMVEVTAGNAGTVRYQIRKPVRVQLSAKYIFFRLDGLITPVPLEGGITLSATYQGASEKFFKDMEYQSVDTQ